MSTMVTRLLTKYHSSDVCCCGHKSHALWVLGHQDSFPFSLFMYVEAQVAATLGKHLTDEYDLEFAGNTTITDIRLPLAPRDVIYQVT